MTFKRARHSDRWLLLALTVFVSIGAACTSDAACNKVGGTNGLCMMGADFPGGYCVSPGCTPTSPTAGTTDSCGAGALCFNVGIAPFRSCLKSCTSTNDCRGAEAYVCDEETVCWPSE